MAEQLHIHQLKTRYRLSSRTRESRARLDGLLQRVLHESLDEAMQTLHLSSDEELCIRELNSLVHLRLQDADSSIARQWGQSLAVAIQQALRERDSTRVINYRSRLHALHDFASGLAHGNLRRAWAWRQLGFIVDETDLSMDKAAGQWVGAMLDEPHLIMPLLVAVTRENQLPALARRLRPEPWKRLSGAVAGRSVPATPAIPGPGSSDAKSHRVRVSQALSRSHIASVLLSHPQVFTQQRVALATWMVFVAAELEPAVFLRSQRQLSGWLDQLARELVNEQPALAPLAGDSWAATTHTEESWQADGAVRLAVENTSATDAISLDDNRILDEPSTDPVPPRQRGNRPGEAAKAEQEQATAATDDPVLQPRDEEEQVVAWQEPEYLDTRWGGLFFLYRLMDELEIPRRLLEDPALGMRPFDWCLYHFVDVLLPFLPEPAVRMVFAGASPDESPPWQDEAAINQDERAALLALNGILVDTLMARLDWRRDSGEMLCWLCDRPARLQVEPGWLKVFLPFAVIDTGIRRAMLDLNPGYVPWLGRVVEIVYE